MNNILWDKTKYKNIIKTFQNNLKIEQFFFPISLEDIPNVYLEFSLSIPVKTDQF